MRNESKEESKRGRNGGIREQWSAEKGWNGKSREEKNTGGEKRESRKKVRVEGV